MPVAAGATVPLLPLPGGELIEAFIDAALPEFGRLVRRTRYAARHHAARASAAGRQSLRFDRESHLDKMAEFAPADLDDVAGERESELAYGGDW